MTVKVGIIGGGLIGAQHAKKLFGFDDVRVVAVADVAPMILERVMPFFVEKPLAVDLSTAETIAEGVRRHGIITAVGYFWRYLDIVERARQLLSRTEPRLAVGDTG
jgi:predicted dehydrogenase